MTMVCDRCGETFECPEFSISERTQKVENNSICRCITKKNRKIFIYSDDPFFLCPSCMEKLNNWLKGEQERQAKWIFDHESNSTSATSAEQNTNSRRMNVYRILIIALTVAQRWKG